MKKRLIIISLIVGFVGGIHTYSRTIGKNQQKKIEQWKDNYFKFYEFYCVLNQWLRIHIEGKSIEEYLVKNNYHNIAIYGMKELGEALLMELKDSKINVKYAIDKNAGDIHTTVKMLKPNDELDEVDLVIVTAIHWFDEIEIEMRDKFKCPILSIDDVLFDL